jgi:hypothetical protein
MSGQPSSPTNDPIPDPDRATEEQEQPVPVDLDKFLRESEEYFEDLETKTFVSDSLQQLNEWITEVPPKDSADDADEPLF